MARHWCSTEQLRPVSPGQSGELYLGGRLLARGYLGRPGLTAERFVPHPSVPGARLYRTGDLVRELDGGLQFLGRDDGQLKIRGHRVEPLEVAAALTRHPDVLQAHVEAHRSDGQNRLLGYLVPRDQRRVPTAAAVRAHLRERLPEYLIPSAFAVLDALPCLPNGKVDRAALPPIEPARGADRADYVAPRSELERRLAAIWCQTLGLDQVGVTDDLFELGGHSLTATRIAARIQAEEQAPVTPIEVISMPTIERLARLVAERRVEPKAGGLPKLTGGDRRRTLLSRQQEQVWLHTSLAPDSIAYHTQTTIRVVGPLDLDLFDRAITELARRHAILRTSYLQQDGELWQLVHDPEPVRADRIDLTGLPAADRERAAEELVQQELHRPFQLDRLPLLRWTAIRLAAQEHELVLVEHHMVHDGWSFALLMRELKALYNAYAQGETPQLAEPGVQYYDYAEWQRQELAALDSAGPDSDGSGADGPGRVLAGQLDYWRKQLDGMPAPLTVPPDRPRPTVQTYRGNTLRIELPPQLPAALRAFGRTNRLTLFCTMYAAFAALLHAYTGERDVCIGSAYANRQLPGSQDVVGMFVNAVVQRCDVDPDQPFLELARRAQEVVFEAAQHQELPFVELVRALNPQRDAAVQPMAPILFSVNDSPLPELDLAGATGTVFERGNGSAKTDLDVVVIPRAESQTADSGQLDDRILLLWEYNADLYLESTMRRMADRYLRLLAAAVAGPDTPVGELTLADEIDLAHETAPTPAVPAFDDVPAAVLRRAEASPDAIAVASAGEQLSYAELASRGRRLAGRLRRAGVAEGDVVAVLLPRGPELVVAELGVLLAGAAFLPLDPGTPAERIAFCCADAKVRCAISGTTGELPAGLTVLDPLGAEAEAAADIEPVDPQPGQPAYLIYTSGSTGTPKGVLVSRAALANLVGWHRSALGLDEHDRSVLFASPAFDVSVGEIWPTLAAGASLQVPPEEVRLVPGRLRDWLAEQRITVADLPTTLAEALLGMAEPPGSLRLLLTGGDRLTAGPRPDTPYALVNAYGPTETTVTATWAEIGSDTGLPGIGEPIPGLVARVLDDRLRPVPVGIPGELCLGGAGPCPGLPEPSGADRRTLRAGSVRAARRAALPHRRPGPASGRRIAGLPRPHRRPDQAARLPDRAGGDRHRAAPATRHRPGARRRGAGGRRIGAAGRLPGPPAGAAGAQSGRAARTARRAAAGLHGADPLRLAGRAADDPQRQDRCAAAAAATGAAGRGAGRPADRRRHRAAAGRDLAGRAAAVPGGAGGQLLRPGRPLAAARPGASADHRRTASGSAVDHAVPLSDHRGAGPSPERSGRAGRSAGRAGAGGSRRGPAAADQTASPPVTAQPMLDERAEELAGTDTQLAVIGMAVRFPGARTLAEFWRNLAGGVESISRLPAPDGARHQPACGVLDDPDCFDAEFFGYAPRDALIIDPQHRIFLECAWQALEHAGYDPSPASGRDRGVRRQQPDRVCRPAAGSPGQPAAGRRRPISSCGSAAASTS